MPPRSMTSTPPICATSLCLIPRTRTMRSRDSFAPVRDSIRLMSKLSRFPALRETTTRMLVWERGFCWLFKLSVLFLVTLERVLCIRSGVMFRKAPINGNEDILGALSIVLYTLIVIPLLKYVLVVLWANDDGEGGTFALYLLICRNAGESSSQSVANRCPGFRLKVPSPELVRSLKIRERLETSLALKKNLLLVVLAGISMVIANGVVTSTMSVLSSVNGLKVGVDVIKQDEVVMISVACLIALFSVQKYGTSKVGLAVGPALFIWFCSLVGIGIYNLVKYDSSVLRAFNPIHIYYFFARNSTKAWYLLGAVFFVRLALRLCLQIFAISLYGQFSLHLYLLFYRAYCWVIWVKLHTLWKTMLMLAMPSIFLFQVGYSGQLSSLQTLLH